VPPGDRTGERSARRRLAWLGRLSQAIGVVLIVAGGMVVW